MPNSIKCKPQRTVRLRCFVCRKEIADPKTIYDEKQGRLICSLKCYDLWVGRGENAV
jgi:hypothetical protein